MKKSKAPDIFADLPRIFGVKISDEDFQKDEEYDIREQMELA